MNKVKYIAILGLVLLLSACDKPNLDQQPVEITWDRDACMECSMVISDHKFATQIIDGKGKGHIFDDIGCAINWLKDKPWKDEAKIWVSDIETERWIQADKANWSYGNPNTPMGYGFSATLANVENSLDFKKVLHQINNNQTLRHQHLQQQVRHGHQMPKIQENSKNIPQFSAKPEIKKHKMKHGS